MTRRALGVEWVAPMQHGEIVPHQEIADLPFIAHGKARLRRMCPERVEQRFALGHAEAEHIASDHNRSEKNPTIGGGRSTGNPAAPKTRPNPLISFDFRAPTY